jgi:hypothetical protein
MAPDETPDIEGQDQAEVFDEENITQDGRDIATSDMQPDVLDVTRTADDGDLDEALDAEPDFDPDEMDEAEYEGLVQGEEDLDGPEQATRDQGDMVADDGGGPEAFEGEAFVVGGDDEGEPGSPDELIAEERDEHSALNDPEP